MKLDLTSTIEDWLILSDYYEELKYDNVVDIIRNTIIKWKEEYKNKEPQYNRTYKSYEWLLEQDKVDLKSSIKREIFYRMPLVYKNGEYILPYYSITGDTLKEYNTEEQTWEALLLAYIEHKSKE